MAPPDSSIEEIAKVTLGQEDSKRPPPAHYVQALSSFLKTNPMDVHFIMEFGEQGKEVGGNGFGSVTCMEDYCWKDIILGPDPSTPLDKQRKHGLGSFFNYRIHCQDAQHVQGRNERCRKEGIPLKPTADPLASAQPNAAAQPAASSSSSSSSRSTLPANPPRAVPSGPSSNPSANRGVVSVLDDMSRQGAQRSAPSPAPYNGNPAFRHLAHPHNPSASSSSTSASRATNMPSSSTSLSRAKSNSQVLDPIDTNDPKLRRPSQSGDTKPKMIDLSSSPAMGRIEPILDDDDDDVIEITGSRVPPAMRKGREAPIMVRDSSSAASRSSTNQKQPQPPKPASQTLASQVRLGNGYLVKSEPVGPAGASSSSQGIAIGALGAQPNSAPSRPAIPHRNSIHSGTVKSEPTRQPVVNGSQATSVRSAPTSAAPVSSPTCCMIPPETAYERYRQEVIYWQGATRARYVANGQSSIPSSLRNTENKRVKFLFDRLDEYVKTGKLPQTWTPPNPILIGDSHEFKRLERNWKSSDRARSLKHERHILEEKRAAARRASQPGARSATTGFSYGPAQPTSAPASRAVIPKAESWSSRLNAMQSAGPSSRPIASASSQSHGTLVPKPEPAHSMPGAMPLVPAQQQQPNAARVLYDQITQLAQAFGPAAGHGRAPAAYPAAGGLGPLDIKPGQSIVPAMPGMPGMYPAHGVGAYPEIDHEAMLEFGMEYDRPDNLQEFFTNSLDSFDEDQDVEGALRYLKLPTLQDRFMDLAVTLMPHQVLGVKFMLEQERNNRMKGGILADSMGLGKTLSSIATMVGNPSEDRKVKTTLVIAPLALLQQWKSEIETKALTPRKVLIYWGPKRTDSPSQLKQYDVVITTYGILNAEHGAENKPKKKKGKKKARAGADEDELDDDDDDSDVPINPHKKGPLFKIYWYRIILDEAHSIRNRNTKASKAAHDLEGNLRWCLTGTPVVNSLCDLYPLLHFLRISPQREWKEFRKHIGTHEKRRPKLATKRAQVILKTCSMRRNKESTLNGVRLLNLPDKIITWDELELSAEERHIYHSIETRMQVKFNSLLKRGTVLKHYSMVLVMLIRLKQCTAHPWLLTRRPEDASHPDDVEISDEELLGTHDAALVDDMRELQRAVDLMGQEYCDKVAKKLEERHLQTANAAKDEEIRDTECAICFEPFEHEHAERITQCFHSFCATCTEELFNAAPRTIDLTEEQQKKGMRQCPMCREAIERTKIFRASAFFNPSAEDKKPEVIAGEAGPSTSLGKRPSPSQEGDVKPVVKKLQVDKGKGKDVDRGDDPAEPNDKPVVFDTDMLNITPSTKMKHLLVIEEKLQDPTVKVVAYSQFTSFLDLCGSFLRMRGIANLQYQGSMAASERQGVLDDFNRPTDQGGDYRVLLLSLKAGGVGLNLTISNVVVALDLAWNAATEDQAVDRCHRIGQTREVDVRRLVVKNTIDQRIRALQETKRSLADGALGEGEAGKLGRLSLGDLIRLFNVDGSGEDV